MYLPDPATLADLGFTLARTTGGYDPSMTYEHPTGCGVVLWGGEPAEIRLFVTPGRNEPNWRARYEGPVASEAAFQALVALHFPALT